MAGAKSKLHRCLICSTQYKYSQALHFTEKVKIFEASSKLLKVQKPELEGLWWNFQKEDLPFCSSCLFSAQLLSDLKSQLDSLQSSIKRTVDRIKVEMLNSQSTTPLVRLEREDYFRNQAMAELVPILEVEQISNGAEGKATSMDESSFTEPSEDELENLFVPYDDEDEDVGTESPVKIEYEWDDDAVDDIQNDSMDSMTDSRTPIIPSIPGVDMEDVNSNHNVYNNSDDVTIAVEAALSYTSSAAKRSRKSTSAPVSQSTRTRPKRTSTTRRESDGGNSTVKAEVPLDPGPSRASGLRRRKDKFKKYLLTEEQLNSYKNYNWKTVGFTTPDGKAMFHGFELLEVEPGKFQCEDCETLFRNKFNLIQHIKFMHLGMTREKELILKHSSSEGGVVPDLKRRKLELILKTKVTKARLKTMHQRRQNLKRLQASKKESKSKAGKVKKADPEQGSSSPSPETVSRRKSTRKSIKKPKPEISLEEEDVDTYKTCSFRTSGVKTPDGKEMFGGFELKKRDGNQYECVACSNIFRNKYNLCDHIKFQHLGFNRKKARLIRELKPPKKIYPKICKGADGRLMVDRFEMRQLPDGVWACGQCGRHVKKKHNMLLHIRSIHLGIKEKIIRKPRVVPQGPKTIKQLLRGKTVFSEDGRRFYEGIEVIPFEATTNNFKYKCGACSKDFNSSGGIMTHIKRNHLRKDSSKLIPCPSCDKKFAYVSLLRDHEGMHQIPEHVCENCGLRFKHRSSLWSHKARVHNQIRNHKCNFCDKMFHTRKDCRLHTRTHTKERPYVCSCSAAFALSASLKKHQASHGHSNSIELKSTTDQQGQSSSEISEFQAEDF